MTLRTPAQASEPRTAVSPCLPPGGWTWIGSKSRTKPAASAAAAATSDVSGSKDVDPMLTKEPTPRPSSTADACLYPKTEMHNISAKLTNAPAATGEPQRVPPRNWLTRRVSTAQNTTATHVPTEATLATRLSYDQCPFD